MRSRSGTAPRRRATGSTAIVANPAAQGYRLVKASGRSVGFGDAPGGTGPAGTQSTCGHATARLELPSSAIGAGTSTTGYFVVDNETGHPLSLRTAGKCKEKWAVTIGNDDIPNVPMFTRGCTKQPLVFPVGPEPAIVHRAGRLRRGDGGVPGARMRFRPVSTRRASSAAVTRPRPSRPCP